jgi:hypothetical protein
VVKALKTRRATATKSRRGNRIAAIVPCAAQSVKRDLLAPHRS